jgi:SAM-dependent methyltransferase
MSHSPRLDPDFWDHQYLPLKRLGQSIQRFLAEQIRLSSGQRVVDLGCGDCPYAELFRNRGCDYVTCDLDGDVDVRIQDGAPLDLPDGSADGVVSFQVLEHIRDLDWYLGEARRILKPGGWLLLSTHGAWLYHPHPGDYRRWTRDGLVAELEHRGFHVDTIHGDVGPLAWTTQFRLLGFREVLRRIPVVRSVVLLPLICLMNLRMILEDAITPDAIRQSNACSYVTLSHKRAGKTESCDHTT